MKPKHLIHRFVTLLALLGFVAVLATTTACSSTPQTTKEENATLQIVTTTTMLYDLATVIGGDAVTVTGLFSAGIDPHLYQASAGDVTTLTQADVIFYNGLHLEAAMSDVFDAMQAQGKTIICIADALATTDLLATEDGTAGAYDPHVWFDVSLWMDAARYTAAQLATIDPAQSEIYQQNLAAYLLELQALEEYILAQVATLPAENRVLITAHDAFGYFGQAYGFTVLGIQGISTASEASTAALRTLATLIATQEIKAIFVETSVSSRTVEALQEAVQAQGFAVAIGGALYSDSLGDASSGHDCYLAMVRANIDTIVAGLR